MRSKHAFIRSRMTRRRKRRECIRRINHMLERLEPRMLMAADPPPFLFEVDAVFAEQRLFHPETYVQREVDEIAPAFEDFSVESPVTLAPPGGNASGSLAFTVDASAIDETTFELSVSATLDYQASGSNTVLSIVNEWVGVGVDVYARTSYDGADTMVGEMTFNIQKSFSGTGTDDQNLARVEVFDYGTHDAPLGTISEPIKGPGFQDSKLWEGIEYVHLGRTYLEPFFGWGLTFPDGYAADSDISVDAQITGTIERLPPQPYIDVLQHDDTLQPFRLSGAKSFDVDNAVGETHGIEKYEWYAVNIDEFGDPIGDRFSIGEGEEIEYRFNKAGDYDIILKVTDDDGQFSETSTPVTYATYTDLVASQIKYGPNGLSLQVDITGHPLLEDDNPNIVVYLSKDNTFDSSDPIILEETLTADSPEQITHSLSREQLTGEFTDFPYAILVVDVMDELGEIDETNNELVSVPPPVLNVITHGFAPGGANSVIEPFEDIQSKLEGLPAEESPFKGRVQSIVKRWNSTRFFQGAFSAVAFSKLTEFLADTTGNTKYDRAKQIYEETAIKYSSLSRLIAFNTADQITREVLSIVEEHEDESVPIIQLIGHSRGAAVNAIVSQNLARVGVSVDHYIALDGFSTDWPSGAGTIADTHIPSVAQAHTRANYRVEQSLSEIWKNYISEEQLRLVAAGLRLDEGLSETIERAISNVLGINEKSNLEVFFSEYLGSLDLRAPLWKFDIEEGIQSSESNDPSNHLNVHRKYVESPRQHCDNIIGEFPSDLSAMECGGSRTSPRQRRLCKYVTDASIVPNGELTDIGLLVSEIDTELSQLQSPQTDDDALLLLFYSHLKADLSDVHSFMLWRELQSLLPTTVGHKCFLSGAGRSSISANFMTQRDVRRLQLDFESIEARPGDFLTISVNEAVVGSVDLASLPLGPHTRSFSVPTSLISGNYVVALDGSQGTTTKFMVRDVRLLTSQWHNYDNPSDVSRDGSVTALDALLVINSLDRGRGGDLGDTAPTDDGDYLLDTTADNKVSALDALRVINELARSPVSNSAEYVSSEMLDVWHDDEEDELLELLAINLLSA